MVTINSEFTLLGLIYFHINRTIFFYLSEEAIINCLRYLMVVKALAI